jgi:hypothetical protein
MTSGSLSKSPCQSTGKRPHLGLFLYASDRLLSTEIEPHKGALSNTICLI